MHNTALIDRTRTALTEAFGATTDAPERYFFSPARVNLIGDHIDYCGGMVLPVAVHFGTYLVARPNRLGKVRMLSLNQPGIIEFDTDADLYPEQPPVWGDYVKGVLVEYRQLGVAIPSLDIGIGGDIPGNSLSSSASLEVGIAVLIEAFTGFSMAPDRFANRQALSWLAQRAENHFVGVNCGIMDQAAIALGQDACAMLMNCRDLSIDYIPVELGDYILLIANTCKVRSLTDSAYNQRREEAEHALAVLHPVYGIDSLCALPITSLEEALAHLPDNVLRRRTRHVVSEHQRVVEAARRLAAGDIAGFGELLNRSHHSLQVDYEVTGPELDAMAQLAQAQPGVLGARMTGGGFGGCCVVLLEQGAVSAFIKHTGAGYREAIGYDAEFYPFQIGPGADEIPGAENRQQG